MKYLKTKILLVLTAGGFLINSAFCQVQTGSITGIILSSDGLPAAGVTVAIKEKNKTIVTNAKGSFTFQKLTPANYELTITLTGHETLVKQVTVEAGKTATVNFAVKASAKELQSVTVTGKSEIRKIKEQAFTVTAVDAKKLHNTTKDINQVLNHTSGIRIREEGGLGSNYNFSLNGFSGNQVRFFLDGVPMDNFGASLSLNNLPVNMAERIEVYKGVVPVTLGSDALGGAVNVVTNQKIKKYIDASYSLGSFNTHRLSLNTRYTSKTGFIINANAFYNKSDNNYEISTQIPDPVTGIYGKSVTVKRFHDGYNSKMGQVELGVVNKKWADKLLFGFIASENKKEVQTGLNMEDVAGEVFNSSSSLIPTFKYKKENLFVKGLTLVANANMSFVKTGVTDTSSKTYDWYGNYTYNTFGSTSGEITFNKSMFTFKDRNTFASANVSYEPSKQHSFSLNHNYSNFRREGEDPLSKYPIPFDEPNVLTKNITGLAYKYSTANNRWSATVFAKLFQLTGDIIDADGYGTHDEMNIKHSKTGYGLATQYYILPALQIKASYENTWRLPDGEEIFGNGLLLQSNAVLKPEHSHNFNIGLAGMKNFDKHKLEGEIGYIYRKAGDFIRLESDGQISKYSNLDSVRTTGLEWSVRYTYDDALTVEVNGTYQNILNVNEFENGIRNYTYWDRLPNTPYQFGNFDIGYQFKKVFSTHDNVSLNFSGSYVEKFFLFWPSQGSAGTKYIIPQQFTQDAGVTYSFKNGMYNIAAGCTNLSNAKVYDNFKLQKPGRAFNVKFRYFIHK